MPETFGQWEALEVLGSGGEATVHRARRPKVPGRTPRSIAHDLYHIVRKISAPVDNQALQEDLTNQLSKLVAAAGNPESQFEYGALKVIKCLGSEEDQAHARARVDREIEAMRRFGDDPSCLKIIEVPESPREWFVTHLHPRGALSRSSNRDLFKGQFDRALRAIRHPVALLARIHQEGFVHRDIATKNVFLADDGRLVLGDWGIVWIDDDCTRVTISGEIIGSKDWMPVWVRGHRPDTIKPNFDVYCCGKLLWALTAGNREVVPREFWNTPEFDLTKLFPGSRGIGYSAEIFSRTIVEKERDCLPDARELLELIDDILIRIEIAPDRLRPHYNPACRMCGEGRYGFITKGKTGTYSDDRDRAQQELGLGLTNNAKHVGVCNQCGHVELFIWPNGNPRRAWQWLDAGQ